MDKRTQPEHDFCPRFDVVFALNLNKAGMNGYCHLFAAESNRQGRMAAEEQC